MKLQARIISGFCVVALFTLAVSAIGYWQARNLASALYEVGAVRLPSIQGLDAIREAMGTILSTERTLLLPQIGDETFAAQQKVEREAWVDAEAGRALYEPLPQTPDEAIKWRAFLPMWQAWKADHEALIAQVVRSRSSGDPAELAAAQARSLSSTRALFDQAAAQLAQISRINDEVAAEAKRRSIASRADMVWIVRLMLISATAGVLGAIGLGVLVGRRLTLPIVDVANALSRVAGGDRTVEMPVQSNDEIGQMTKAMNSMVTALRESEAERRRVEDALQQSQKMEAIGQLAGGIAHDFNNILTVILGKASVLVHDARMAAALRDTAADIYRSGERAARLTRQLLAFSRRQAIQKRDVDLNVVVADLASMLQRVIGEEVTVEFVYDLTPACVNVDASMIDQVLLNLAVNARDAMPGGGQISIETRSVEVDEEAARRHPKARPGSFACLVVRDSGTGIAPEHLDHIFEPFFTTKDIGKGTGLGLATSFGIVLQHDGWIEVDSVPGQGTTFRVMLPRKDGPPDAPLPSRATATPASTPSESQTILVVEDEPDVREFVVEALRGMGYRVYEATDGRQALDTWAAHGAGIDLVLTDMVMPGGLTGLDVARALRRDRPTLRVIFTSGYLAETAALPDLLESAEYLPKPFSLADLSDAVRGALRTNAGG